MKSVKWLLIPSIAALGSCSLFRKSELDAMQESSKPPVGPELVGRIASVSSDRHFVLIQSYGPWNRETGAILTTRGDEGRVANLLVTGESSGQFAAADIQSGTVETGDAVYSLHIPTPTEPGDVRVSGAENTENQ